MKITIDLTGTLEALESRRASEAKAKETKRKRKSPKPKDQRTEDLTMRLIASANDSRTSDVDVVQLELDTIAYVKELLASGKKSKAVNFLNENKHRFTPEMKDGLTDVINEGLSSDS